MQAISCLKAKNNFIDLLDRVANGERFIITRHGLPTAMLIPFPNEGSPDVRLVIGEIREFRKKLKLGKLSIKTMIKKGRKRH